MCHDIAKYRRTQIHLAPGNFPIPVFGKLEEVDEDSETYIFYPGCFDEVGLSVKVVVHCNLNEISREVCPTI